MPYQPGEIILYKYCIEALIGEGLSGKSTASPSSN